MLTRDAIFEPLKRHLNFYKYQKDHTVRELAAYCRVTEQTIYNWLKGKTRPSRAKIKLLQEWLESRPKGKGLSEIENSV